MANYSTLENVILDEDVIKKHIEYQEKYGKGQIHLTFEFK